MATTEREKIQHHAHTGAKAVIVGGGPAGLTAAYEFLKGTDIHPVVLEESGDLGGISKTVNYKGNRMDIGGHRFFSKSDEVMDWWRRVMPMEGEIAGQAGNDGVGRTGNDEGQAGNDGAGRTTADPDREMLRRDRSSRIYFHRHFFDYPISMKWQTFAGMGLWGSIRAAFGYLGARLFPRKENSLEDFYINRFGRPLYEMFFEDYTEKVWGVHPSRIGADWGAQRVKGLSVTALLKDILTRPFRRKDLEQKNVETSLIEQFIYPKYGPGQLWEAVGSDIEAAGGEVRRGCRVVGIHLEEAPAGEQTAGRSSPLRGSPPFAGANAGRAVCSPSGALAVTAVDIEHEDGSVSTEACDWLLSSMPIKDLIAAIRDIPVPQEIRDIAENLPYRDFITVGLLVDKLKIPGHDTWIYIQERDVKVGRLQIFNNWSPYMVKDPSGTYFLGLEYFCNEGDPLWEMPDADFIRMATGEMVKIGIIEQGAVLDATRVKVRKAYPAYFGSYKQIGKVRDWLEGITNLYCIGRNGQHRYNNMDHSMLTAMQAVRAIANGGGNKSAVWSVNTDQEYHENK